MHTLAAFRFPSFGQMLRAEHADETFNHRVLGRMLFTTFMLLLISTVLVACSAQQTAAFQKVAVAACAVDGQVQPVAVALAPMAGSVAATAATVDATLIHPAIAAACAKLGGTPIVSAVVPVVAAPATLTNPAPAATTPAPAVKPAG